jgi:hypothetical protein
MKNKLLELGKDEKTQMNFKLYCYSPLGTPRRQMERKGSYAELEQIP